MSESGDTKPEIKRPSVIALIPRLAKLLYHLARDPRVPWTVKAALVGAGVYLASPVDLIPDWVPGAGYLDDVLLVGILVNYIVARVPRDVLVEHWGEDVEALESLRRTRPRRPRAGPQ